jgi:ABC-type uncharacterized transport system fused permease/ATPase subunit
VSKSPPRDRRLADAQRALALLNFDRERTNERSAVEHVPNRPALPLAVVRDRVHHEAMRICRLTITRFRGIEGLSFEPGERTLILGPQNAGKGTVLEALDLLLHHGLGRPRQPPTEID